MLNFSYLQEQPWTLRQHEYRSAIAKFLYPGAIFNIPPAFLRCFDQKAAAVGSSAGEG